MNSQSKNNQSEKSYDEQTVEAYYKIRSRIFDKKLISTTPYAKWDGSEAIDYNDILKLYYSYNFEEMESRGGVKGFMMGNDMRNYLKFKKLRKFLSRILFLSLLVLITALVLWLNDRIQAMAFYAVLVVLYLININLPRFIRTKLKKNRYIKL